MPHPSLLQQTLGDDWGRLPPVIRRHYQVSPQRHSRLQGTLEIAYPTYLKPVIWLIHRCGGLIYRRGTAVRTRVEKRPSPDRHGLCWRRILHYPDGRQDVFASRMEYLRPGELIETVRFGFGLRLTVGVEQSALVYRSNGHLWQCGRFRLYFPDWLLLGRATIVEYPVSERQFRLDFTIRHPLLGVTYYYRGLFNPDISQRRPHYFK